jgi:hypothetical protein
LFQTDVDPKQALLANVVKLRAWSNRSKWTIVLSGVKLLHSSPYTLFVYFAVHTLAELVSDLRFPLEVRQKLAQCLDMYWPAVASIEKMAPGCKTAAAFNDQFGAAWWETLDISLRAVPCGRSLDRRPEMHFANEFSNILARNEPGGLPAVVCLFRKSWPVKLNLKQFVTKCEGLRDDVVDENTERHGTQVMRYLMQWWCVFHVGGYAHSQSIVLHWPTRRYVSRVWNAINTLGTDDVVAETDTILKSPIIAEFVVGEFMEHCIRRSPVIRACLLKRCDWQLYGDYLTEFCDEYRKLLPLDASVDGVAPKAVHYHVYMRKDLNEFLTGKDKVRAPPQPTQISKTMPLGPRAADCMTRAKCIEAMHDFLKRGFAIGNASRLRFVVWEFLNDVLMDPKAMDSDKQVVYEAPQETFEFPDRKCAYHSRGDTLTIDGVAKVMRHLLDAQSHLVHAAPPQAAFWETTALERVHTHRADLFIAAYRVLTVLTTYYGCHRRMVLLLVSLFVMYHEELRCTRPRVALVLAEIKFHYRYEYHVLCGMLKGWSTWRYSSAVTLPHEIVTNQLRSIKSMVENQRLNWVPACLDTLLVCDNCERIYSLVDKPDLRSFEDGDRRVVSHVAGFSKISVDIDMNSGLEDHQRLYCRRKGNKRAQCNMTQLTGFHLCGKIVFLNAKAYSMCCQRGCCNQMERSPQMTFTSSGWACYSCCLRAFTKLNAFVIKREKVAARQLKTAATKRMRLESKAAADKAWKAEGISQDLADKQRAMRGLVPQGLRASAANAAKLTDDAKLGQQRTKIDRLADHNRALRDTRRYVK